MSEVTHFNKVSGENGLYVGSEGNEVEVASSTGQLKQSGTSISSSAAEIDRVADLSSKIVNTTAATLALTLASHDSKIVTVNKADGAALTLPASSGTGAKFTVVIGTTISSNSTTIKVANASDSFVGMAFGVDTDAEGASGYTWNADANDDTVTMDGTAKGGVAGDVWTFTDIAANTWLVEGKLTQSGGSEATPFSASVA
jgi:hypothetical protein